MRLGELQRRGGRIFPAGPPRLTRSSLLTSLSIVLPLVVATLLKETPYFDTNDDVWLMLVTSGRVASPAPNGWVYWLHPFLSHTLASLYRLTNGIPWYGLTHVGSLLLGFWAILYALLLKGFSWRQLALFLTCLTAFGFPSVLSLQFTKTAFFVGLGGAFLCAVTLQLYFSRQETFLPTFLRLGGGFLLLALSLMIRRESLFLVSVLSFPLLAFLAWSARRTQSLLFFFAVLTSLSFPLFVLASVHRNTYARPPEWNRFERLLQLKAAFIDYPRIPYSPQTQAYFREVGWSENDYRCLQRWFYVDREIYSPETLQAIVAHFPVTARSQEDIRRALFGLLSHLRTDGMFRLFVPLWLSLLLLGTRSRPHTLMALALGLGAFFLMSLLVIFFHLPDRVYQPIVMAVCWFTLLFDEGLRTPAVSSRRYPLRRACGLLCLGITILFLLVRADTPLARALAMSRMTQQNNADLRAALMRLNPAPSQTFVVWGGAFPYEAILPLEHHGYLQNLRILALGASNQSPTQRRMLEAQGIHDLPRALFERPDVFLSLSLERGEDKLLVTYLAEHYGVTVTLTPHLQAKPLHFWRVVRADAP